MQLIPVAGGYQDAQTGAFVPQAAGGSLLASGAATTVAPPATTATTSTSSSDSQIVAGLFGLASTAIGATGNVLAATLPSQIRNNPLIASLTPGAPPVVVQQPAPAPGPGLGTVVLGVAVVGGVVLLVVRALRRGGRRR